MCVCAEGKGRESEGKGGGGESVCSYYFQFLANIALNILLYMLDCDIAMVLL